MIDYDAPFSWLDKHPRELCTCCPDPRPAIYRFDGGESWHVEDGTYASFAHTHAHTYMTSCDGPFETYVTNTPQRTDSWLGDNGNGMEDGMALFKRAVGYSVSLHTDFGGTLTVHPFDTESRERRAEWREAHDEGGRYAEVILCPRAHCARETSSQRDHYAEAMGY